MLVWFKQISKSTNDKTSLCWELSDLWFLNVKVGRICVSIKFFCYEGVFYFVLSYRGWCFPSSFIVCHTNLRKESRIDLAPFVLVIIKSFILSESSLAQRLFVKFIGFALKVQVHMMQEYSMWEKELSIDIEKNPFLDKSLWTKLSLLQFGLLMKIFFSQDMSDGHTNWSMFQLLMLFLFINVGVDLFSMLM